MKRHRWLPREGEELYHRAQFGRTAESKSRMKSKIRKRSKSKIRIKIGM